MNFKENVIDILKWAFVFCFAISTVGFCITFFITIMCIVIKYLAYLGSVL